MMFRAMDASQVALYNSFGASGTPVPWTEVYTALQTGVADGQMNPPMYIIMGSLYEVQKYMTLANVQYSMQYLLINEEWINSLSTDQQKAIREAAKEAKLLTMKDVESRVEERVTFIADSGVEVYTPNAADLSQFREIGQPGYITWLETQFDKEWIDICLSSAEMANKKAAE
jgi:TRAP-type C4-dicarboxylate transport system substrate-binding protein